MDALRRWADDEFRSVNGQIEFILARALTDAGRGKAISSPDATEESAPCPPGSANKQSPPRSEG
jgi:hypothetical protein